MKRPKKLPCMTEQMSMRAFYRHELKHGIGFAMCRVYAIKGRAPTGRSVSTEVNP